MAIIVNEFIPKKHFSFTPLNPIRFCVYSIGSQLH